MSSRIRTADVERALEQAANSARNGSPAARSGQIGIEARIVQRILSEAQGAASTWANWEAINTALAPERQAAKAVDHLELGALGTIRNALSRDGLLAAYRLSDPCKPKDELQGATLCRLAHLTAQPDIQEKLKSEQWALDTGHSPFVSAIAAVDNARRLDRLHSTVLAQWRCDVSPKDPELWKLRTLVKPVRDSFLAHSLDIEGVQQPIINDVRRLIQLTLELATDMAFLFLGSAVDAARYQTFCAEQASRFWHFAFKAPIETHAVDTLNRSS